jgi:hypothetical protein
MIEVSVTLISAVDGRREQLALVHITNEGTETVHNPRFGSYAAVSYRGRGAQLEKLSPIKRGKVVHWPREAYHVWNLVRMCLTSLGYTQGQLTCHPCKSERQT